MGYVAQIILALASLALPELVGTSGAELPGFLPALFALPYLIGALTRRLLIAGRFRIGAICERLLALSPPLAQLVAVGLLGWFDTVARWTGVEIELSGWPGLELLLGLIPYVICQLLAIDARLRLLDEPPERLRTARAFQVRLFCSALVPFLVYLTISSLVSLDDAVRVNVEQVDVFGAAFSLLVLVLFVRLLPTLLRNTWDTAPLSDGPLRVLLEGLARRANFRCSEILVWRTGHQMANAAIVGFTPRSRVVLLSDLLIAHLSPRELLAVFAHEMGHAQRRHAMTFASFALVAFLGLDAILTEAGVDDLWLVLSIFGAVMLLWYLAFGMLSRRFELEADLYSLELVGDPEALVVALDKVGGAHAHERSSWRHFSNAERTRFLREAAQDPEVGANLTRRLRRWSRVGLLLLLLVGGVQVWQLARSWPADRVVAALCLGQYERAVARAEGHELETRLAELVLASRPFASQGEVSVEELEESALAALRAGQAVVALDRVELAILRGRVELDPVYEALEELVESAEPGPVGNTEFEQIELPAPWDEALGEGALRR